MKTIFAIGLGKNKLFLLLKKKFFCGIGSISISKNKNMLIYSVNSIKDLTNIIIPHFEKYPLLTQKVTDFILFKRVIEHMNNKDHLTFEGVQQIINIKASMNKGLSNVLINNFNKINPVTRPKILTKNIPNPNWVAGFVTGEGNFDVLISKSKNVKIGYYVTLRFRVFQHNRDEKLIVLLIKYLGVGRLEKYYKNPVLNLIINKISDIIKIIIPYFENNPLFGIKQLNFIDWCKIANLMIEGKHLTNEGLALIRTIKSGIKKR